MDSSVIVSQDSASSTSYLNQQKSFNWNNASQWDCSFNYVTTFLDTFLPSSSLSCLYVLDLIPQHNAKVNLLPLFALLHHVSIFYNIALILYQLGYSLRTLNTLCQDRDHPDYQVGIYWIFNFGDFKVGTKVVGFFRWNLKNREFFLLFG